MLLAKPDYIHHIITSEKISRARFIRRHTYLTDILPRTQMQSCHERRANAVPKEDAKVSFPLVQRQAISQTWQDKRLGLPRPPV